MENSIKRIKIENFRKFENIEIDFNEAQLSSIVGENGTGKTSILDAISLASSNRVGNISEKDFRNKSNPIIITLEYNKYFIIRHERPYGRYKKHMKVLCDSITLEVRMRERASAGQLFNSPFTFKKTANPIKYSDKSTEIKTGKLPGNIKRSNPNIPKQCLLEQEIYKAFLNGEEDEPESLDPLYHFTINTYSNTEYLPYVFYFKKNREKDLKKGMGSLYQKVVEELNWKARNKISENNNLKDKIVKIENEVKISINSFLRNKILNPLKQDLVQISNEFGSLDVKALDIDGFFNSSTLSVVPAHGGEESVPVSSLGSGFEIIVSLFLAKTIASYSKETIIVLIDEPEKHLHPQLEKRLLNSLKAANFQLIFSTHSSYLVDIVDYESVKRLGIDGIVYPQKEMLKSLVHGKELEKHVKDIGKYHYSKTLLQRDHEDLVFAKGVLIVEGSIDKFGFLKIAESKGYDWNEIDIVSTQGKENICHILILTIIYGIPSYVVFDEDNTTVPVSLQSLFEAFSNVYKSSFSNSFESELNISSNVKYKFAKAMEKNR